MNIRYIEKRIELYRVQGVCKFQSVLCALCFLNQSVNGVRLQKTDIPRTLLYMAHFVIRNTDQKD
jgi:hypothetical protein